VIVGARNERLFDAAGREYIDLCAGYGSVWLGHNHAGVNGALSAQLERYAAPGYLPFEALEQARRALAAFIPHGHFVGGIYSTGMEAMETAVRAACAHTGRAHLAGFAGSTHGRSFLTSALGGAAPEPLQPYVHTLPGFSSDEQTIAKALHELASEFALAAIVVEPVQMTGGGYELPGKTCAELFAIARARGSVVIFDETLTGLYRCGARSYAEAAGVQPDIMVLGKGLANGFPASAVSLRQGMAWDRERVRPASTYWNHPLACAGIAATLEELSRVDVPQRVAAIEAIIRSELGGLQLRGRGAMWCLASPQPGRQQRFAEAIMESGVVVSYYEHYIRLLPPLTIAPDVLIQACRMIARAHAHTFG
jgi:4-aminobutyrate aminotransferase-like enzyme